MKDGQRNWLNEREKLKLKYVAISWRRSQLFQNSVEQYVLRTKEHSKRHRYLCMINSRNKKFEIPTGRMSNEEELYFV
jgi:hypothetical protein